MADELLREFLNEVKENLDVLDQSLVSLERNPDDRETLDSLFRSLHSTKGAAGFFSFTRLESVAHAGENLLNAIREGAVRLDRAAADALLTALDVLRDTVRAIEEHGAESPADDAALIDTLTRLAAGGPGAPPPAAQAPAPARAAPEPAAPPPPRAEPAHVGGTPTTPPPAEAVESVRVDVQLLDELMDLVGELVLSRNQILQVMQGQQRVGAELTQSSQQLDRITTALQERVMKTRMQPIKHVWSKFPRIVRDLSASLGKRVRLEMEGEETELDRTLIEAIKDPLTHLVRNAIDHGVETPDKRIAAGKDPEGRFRLRAFHESGQVIIEVDDDGAGINVDRLRQKSIEKGLLTADQAASLSPKEALHLIFRAGLSTAEKVTMVSGRGVGMDVVRSNIERIGGTIEVESRLGEGTRFRVKIPLTLAIIPALLVNCESARFAIPQVSVQELIRLKAEDAPRAIEVIHGTIATRLRGRILPLVDLRDVLSQGRSESSVLRTLVRRSSLGRSVNIVVLSANGRAFGLLVDGVEESQEIVVKPLSRQLQDISVYAGATILGDGSIALILDAVGVAMHGRVLREGEEIENASDDDAAAASSGPMQTLLLAEAAGDGRLAIPLEAVARLEKFPVAALERAGPLEVVKYRGDILRLVRLEDVLPLAGSARDETDVLEVVVLRDEGVPVGVVVRRIVDIVETPADSVRPSSRAGILGTAVIRDRVTELLDVRSARRVASPPEVAAHA